MQNSRRPHKHIDVVTSQDDCIRLAFVVRYVAVGSHYWDGKRKCCRFSKYQAIKNLIKSSVCAYFDYSRPHSWLCCTYVNELSSFDRVTKSMRDLDGTIPSKNSDQGCSWMF